MSKMCDMIIISIDFPRSWSRHNDTFPQIDVPGHLYVNSATIFHLRSSHLLFFTPLPPPTVHLQRRLHILNTVSNLHK